MCIRDSLEGIKLQNAEIEAIIQNPEKADFSNTIEAFEESGERCV